MQTKEEVCDVKVDKKDINNYFENFAHFYFNLFFYSTTLKMKIPLSFAREIASS